MASCLGCGSRHARVLYARTVKVVLEADPAVIVRRECWRIVACPACGSRRRQTIHDEGETARAWVPKGDEFSVR